MFNSVEPLKLTPQQARIIQYMEPGSTLTNVVAMTVLQVGSLSRRITELRRLGFTIKDRMDQGHDGRSFKKYDLDQDAAQPAWTLDKEQP